MDHFLTQSKNGKLYTGGYEGRQKKRQQKDYQEEEVTLASVPLPSQSLLPWLHIPPASLSILSSHFQKQTSFPFTDMLWPHHARHVRYQSDLFIWIHDAAVLCLTVLDSPISKLNTHIKA